MPAMMVRADDLCRTAINNDGSLERRPAQRHGHGRPTYPEWHSLYRQLADGCAMAPAKITMPDGFTYETASVPAEEIDGARQPATYPKR